MSNFIINNISIISPDTKKAKYQDFQKGINIVVGDKEKGNFIGKSSLLRSIFHTIGADAKFAKDDWEREGAYIYILDFSVNDNLYTMVRKQELFRLFDSQNNEIFKVINRIDLAKKLNELFLDEIYLLGQNNKYSLAHPVYSYLLNYIEQKEIKLCEFRSFNNLTAFHGSYYSDLLYSLLGVDSKDYSNAVTNKKELEEELKLHQNTEKSLTEMLQIINSKSDKELSVDELQTLKDSLSRFEDEYSSLSSEANKTKQKLYEAYNAKAELENLLVEINASMSSVERQNKVIAKGHTCPLCNNELEHKSHIYFNSSNEAENYTYQLLDVEKDLANIERKIDLLLDKYNDYLEKIKSIEDRIFENKSEISEKIELIGLRKIKSNINNEINDNRVDIQTVNIKIENEKSIIRNLKKLRAEVDEFYVTKLNEVSFNYDIRIPSLDSISKVDQKFQVDGNQIMITTVAWLCALLETRYEFNQDATILPLVYDNPNNANFDASNDYKIFKLLFDHLPTDGQVITSCVGFEIEKYEDDFDINVIELKNPQYQLLNTMDYEFCLEKLNKLR